MEQKTGFRTGKQAIFLVLSIFILAVQAAQANLLLEFEVEETTKKQNESAETTTEKLHVDIGPDYFSYENAEERVIYDFKSRRIYRVNLSRKDYQDDSLFTDIGFRSYEFRNRLALGEILEKSGIEENPMAVTMSEHIFSISHKDHKSGIRKKRIKSETVFLWEGKKLAGFSKKLLKVDEEQKRGFIRFLRYYQSVHPEILSELSKFKGIPLGYEIYRSNVVDSTILLKLGTHTITPEKSYDLTAFKKASVDGELSSLIPPGTLHTTAALRDKAKEVMTAADKAYAGKRYLDSMLAYMEYHLMTGESLPPEFQAKREVLVQSEEVKNMVASINPKSKEEAEKAVEILVDLQKKSKDRKHVLLIFEANVRQSLQQTENTKKNFIAALSANPYIVGAWKDLGDLYFNEYNTRDAWRCWDLARGLLPTHGLLKTVNEFEQNLLNTYPEFL